MEEKKIQSALISVFSKDGIKPIVDELRKRNVTIYSTGGTFEYIDRLGHEVIKVESVTDYPSILGGRVKTLHPKIFGGILSRRELNSDKEQLEKYNIPEFDLVIVDLYPFEKTVSSGASDQDIIEKIDIGGITLIRAAAKNYKDVLIVSEMSQYNEVLSILENENGSTVLETRKKFATRAFNISSHYDTAIFNYFNEDEICFKQSIRNNKYLRYGENPHQKGVFFGDLEDMFQQLHG